MDDVCPPHIFFLFYCVFSCVHQPYYSENYHAYKDYILFYPKSDAPGMFMTLSIMTNQEERDILKP